MGHIKNSIELLTSNRNSNSELLLFKENNLVLLLSKPYAAVLMLLKSRDNSRTVKSTSNGAICSRNISKCFIRNRWPLIAPCKVFGENKIKLYARNGNQSYILHKQQFNKSTWSKKFNKAAKNETLKYSFKVRSRKDKKIQRLFQPSFKDCSKTFETSSW